jgi:hypothetical protein
MEREITAVTCSHARRLCVSTIAAEVAARTVVGRDREESRRNRRRRGPGRMGGLLGGGRALERPAARTVRRTGAVTAGSARTAANCTADQ